MLQTNYHKVKVINIEVGTVVYGGINFTLCRLFNNCKPHNMFFVSTVIVWGKYLLYASDSF